jgi:hypothetical protein
MSQWMSDDAIEAALSHSCICCPADTGEECVEPITGVPLIETKGYPVHIRRMEP